MCLVSIGYAKIVGLPARTASEPTMYGGYEGSVFGGIIEVGEILVLMEDALRVVLVLRIDFGTDWS